MASLFVYSVYWGRSTYVYVQLPPREGCFPFFGWLSRRSNRAPTTIAHMGTQRSRDWPQLDYQHVGRQREGRPWRRGKNPFSAHPPAYRTESWIFRRAFAEVAAPRALKRGNSAGGSARRRGQDGVPHYMVGGLALRKG